MDTVTSLRRLCGSHQDQMARWGKGFSRKPLTTFPILLLLEGEDYFHMRTAEAIPSLFNSFNFHVLFSFHLTHLFVELPGCSDSGDDQAADVRWLLPRTSQRKIKLFSRAKDIITGQRFSMKTPLFSDL